MSQDVGQPNHTNQTVFWSGIVYTILQITNIMIMAYAALLTNNNLKVLERKRKVI